MEKGRPKLSGLADPGVTPRSDQSRHIVSRRLTLALLKNTTEARSQCACFSFFWRVLKLNTALSDASVTTSVTDDSSETIRPNYPPLQSSTRGARQNDRGSGSSDASNPTYPSVSSQARYDSSYMSESSSSPGGIQLPISPTNITSPVSSLRSDRTNERHDTLRIHSPFGEVPRGPLMVSGDINSSRSNANTLPCGFHAQDRPRAASTGGAFNRSMPTAANGKHRTDTGPSQRDADGSKDGKREGSISQN